MARILLIIALMSALADRAFTDTNYRLNTNIKPKAYSIAITPYFDTKDDLAFTFDGEVDITLTTGEPTSKIKLHSEDLIFQAANITILNGGKALKLDATNPLEFDKKYSFAYINLGDVLQVNVEYSLKISYRGPIRDDLSGFYRNYYVEKGVKKWLGATQLESTSARKVFPCFDEPGLKATFSLTIDRPEHYKPSLANTKLQQSVPLSNGYIRDIFFPSPVMPTYLVAFLVSEFEGVEKLINGSTNEFGVFARPEALNQSEYAVDFGMRVVTALGNYFGIDYYSTESNLKLDHVALPDFKAGAMENWGLVIYRESLLLYVAGVSNPYYKYRVAQIIAHETTHMWFGDLVTCHWWSDTWLNEGFASYFQDYITALIEPEVGSGTLLVTSSVWTGYDADSSPDSPAMTHEVNSPDEISAHFGAITYQKAGSIIRMMHHLMGDEAFKFGLNSYLEANKFGSGYPEKMYEALDIGARSHNALTAYPDTDVAEVMSSWVSQPGHPVLHVNVDFEDGTVTLTQKRFYIDSKHSSNETYLIPITYTTGQSADFENTKPAFIMKDATHKFSIANLSHSWVLFNIQETGFYRVNYDDHSWEHIASALKSDDRRNIHHLNRAKIINDLFAFLYADEVKFDRITTVLESMDKEDSYSVWYATVRGFNKLYKSYLGSDAVADIQDYILEILEHAINKLGYDADEDVEEFETIRNRMQVLDLACRLGHAGCMQHMTSLFKGLRENGTEIPSSLRQVAYCTALRSGNGSDYDFLWERMSTTNIANEARDIGEILGCTTDESKLRSYLVSMLEEESPIRYQDLAVPLSSVLSNSSNWNIVLDELKKNYSLWTSIYKTMDSVLSSVAAALHTEEDFTEFEEFLSSCTECTDKAKASATASLASARAATAWAKNHEKAIVNEIHNSQGKSSGILTVPSLMPICIVFAVLLETFLFFL